jgi:hypothetical protein
MTLSHFAREVQVWRGLAPRAQVLLDELNHTVGHYSERPSIAFSPSHDRFASLVGTVADYLMGLIIGDSLRCVIDRAGLFASGQVLPVEPEAFALAAEDFELRVAERFLRRLRGEIRAYRAGKPEDEDLIRLLGILYRFDGMARGGALPGSYRLPAYCPGNGVSSEEDAVSLAVAESAPREIVRELHDLHTVMREMFKGFKHSRYNPVLSGDSVPIGADGDLIADQALFELKCVRRFRIEHVHQVLGYCLLARLNHTKPRIIRAGFLNPFYWLKWSATVEELFRATDFRQEATLRAMCAWERGAGICDLG